MKEQKKYTNHRDNQVDRILDAAESLFIKHGIDLISIGEIADEARISRKTIYEYFPNKQEIAWAIFQKFSQETISTVESWPLPGNNGYQNIESFLFRIVDMLETNPEHMRFIVEFNVLYAKEGNSARVQQMYVAQSQKLCQLVQMGIKDGSLRSDLNPDLECSAMLNLLAALNNRFALLGNRIAEEYGYPYLEIYRGICRSYLRGIQFNQKPPPFNHEEIIKG